MHDWLDVLIEGVTVLLLLIGSAWILIAAVGLIRLPDLHCRSHAMGKAVTMGITLILIAVGIYLGADRAGLKVFLAIVFQFLTIPVASHLLLLLAYRKNHPRWMHRRINRAE